MTINRGTPTTADDLEVRDGQAWISVTSGSEGQTHVTAFAPEVRGWDRRQQSATIYWVDAQWRFPSPSVSPMGGRSTLTTVVSRQSDGSPLSGWVVRYEIAGGPPAALAPDGQQVVEILTNTNGEAPAEIYQQTPTPGTNTVTIQLIRPPVAGEQTRPLPIGSGAVVQTWTSGDAILPPGMSPAQGPQTFTPVPQSPPIAVGPTQGMPSEQPQVLQPPYSQPSSAEPTPSLDPNTPVPSPQTSTPAGSPVLEVAIHAPPIAVVGSDVQFEIEVRNRGNATATGLLVTDRFAEGLEHASSPPNRAIDRSLVDLHPGETSRVMVVFRVSKSGELCQEVTVQANGLEPATARNCITANESALGPEPQPPITVPTPADSGQSPSPGQGPQAPAPTPANPTFASPQLTVIKRGPASRRVGESALFEIEVSNNTDQTFENIEIADNHELSLEPLRATGGSQWLSGNALGWRIDALEPGRTIRREIELKCLRETPRSCNRVTVTANNMDPVADEACLEILADAIAPSTPTTPADPSGVPTITVTAVETADPIRINGQTGYQIILTNTGEESAYDVEVVLRHDSVLQLLRSEGPVRGSVTSDGIRYPAIRELRAGETQAFDLRFKGAREGVGAVHVEVMARGLSSPVTAEQSTEVLP